MSIRSQGFKSWLRKTAALSLLALLAACGTTGAIPPSTADNGYLLTVKINSSDTQSSIAQKYGGQTIAWQPDNGMAILKMTQQAVAQMKSRGISMQGTTLDSNAKTTAPEPVSAQGLMTAEGWNTWAGGWNTWAGGWNTWAGGWNAWAGGTGPMNSIPALPQENRRAFENSRLRQGQAINRNFGAGITVAVIDTGIDLNHPMFNGRLAPSSQWWDYVGNDALPQEETGAMYGHGTAVAGLILQFAPRATILPIRVLNGDGAGDVANVISAISWAMQQGAKVINLSLGTTDNNAALQSMINSANTQGIYVVASAGNTGDTNITYPAAWAKSGSYAKYLLSVGSVNDQMALSVFSCSGTALEFLATGERIASAYPNSQVASFNGTSFAAPQVSGSLALALGDTSTSNKGNLESYLSNSDIPVGSYGLINVAGQLQQAPDFVDKTVLYVAGSDKGNSSDVLLISRLQGLGYAVTLVDDDNTSTGQATGFNLVLISASADKSKVTTKFRSVGVPVVVWDYELYDDMGLTNAGSSEANTQDGQTQITLTSLDHPLSAGLNLSSSPVIYSAKDKVAWGKPSGAAIVIANVLNDSTRPVLFAYNTGTQMVGLVAPARRVGFLLKDNQASRLTDTGWSLFDSAITWAVSGN